jgi:DNA transposition AAA+ family ATPase
MPKLTQQEYIRQELQALLEKKGLSQNELARMTDVSAASISHILNGRTDKTVSEEIWNKAAAPLRALNGLHLLTTAGYKAVVATCEAAQADCTLSIVLGQPGHGKTAALRHYFKQQPNVYFTEFWYSMSRREFFVAVAKALAVDAGKRPTLAHLIQRCADKLNAVTGSLLIIDKASTMQPEKLNYVRELRERTQHNAGIILAGVPYFYARLERYATCERDGVPELLSRVGGKRMPPAPTKRELVDVAEANGIGRDVMQARAERWCGPARIPDAGPLDSQAAGTSGPAGRNR